MASIVYAVSQWAQLEKQSDHLGRSVVRVRDPRPILKEPVTRHRRAFGVLEWINTLLRDSTLCGRLVEAASVIYAPPLTRTKAQSRPSNLALARRHHGKRDSLGRMVCHGAQNARNIWRLAACGHDRHDRLGGCRAIARSPTS